MFGYNSAESEGVSASRRRFLRTAAATGVGGAALSGLSGGAAAHEEGHGSYTIREGTDHETTVHVYRAPEDGPTTLVVGGMHGDEHSGWPAAEAIAEWEVDRGVLVTLPYANRVAVDRDTRECSHGDLNRQFPPTGGTCDTATARAIWEVVERHDPDWAFDLHSSYGIYDSGDGGVGQAMFPTWTSPARSYGENTVAALNDEFDLDGEMAYEMGNTLDADRKMLMHRVAGVLDRPGYIIETTRKADSLSDEIAWHLFCVEHVMNRYGQRRATGSSDGGGASDGGESVTFDAGMIALEEYAWEFTVDTHYYHPVVVAPALSYAGSDPAHVRVTDYANKGFEARVEEWEYLNEIHYEEQVGYLMFDTGAYATDGGNRIEAGRNLVDDEWATVSFREQFPSAPALFTTSQSSHGAQPVVARCRGLTRSGFEYRIQEEEANNDSHSEEMTGWLAVERGQGALNGRRYEAGHVSGNHDWQHIEFARSYGNPTFVADVSSFEGWNPVGVRFRNLTADGVDVLVEEERSDDSETHHIEETVSYFVIEG